MTDPNSTNETGTDPTVHLPVDPEGLPGEASETIEMGTAEMVDQETPAADEDTQDPDVGQ